MKNAGTTEYTILTRVAVKDDATTTPHRWNMYFIVSNPSAGENIHADCHIRRGVALLYIWVNVLTYKT